jgi:hypothetical protein
MISTTHEPRESGQPQCDFPILMSMLSRLYWLLALFLSVTLLAACGGSGSTDANPPGPTANDLIYAGSAGLSASLSLTTNWVTLTWSDTVPGASRYEIEQQNADGSWSVIDAVWATQASQLTLHWTGPAADSMVLRVVAVMSGYTVALSTAGGSAAGQQITVALPSQIPSIAIDQTEPLQGTVDFSIANGGTYNNVTYSIDTATSIIGDATDAPYSLSWDTDTTWGTDTITTGAHTVYAQLQVSEFFSLELSRSVQIHTSSIALNVTLIYNPSTVDIYGVATSDSGIVSVTAANNNDGQALGTLFTPNACTPTPCAAGQSFNSYHFSLDIHSPGSSYQTIQVEALDAAGYVASTNIGISLPSPPTASLISPVNGASVEGALPVTGTYASGTPGALEVMVTLSGVPVYDNTVANPGSIVPFSTNVSLAGVPGGIHSVDVYARVGSASYQLLASAFVVVTGAQ